MQCHIDKNPKQQECTNMDTPLSCQNGIDVNQTFDRTFDEQIDKAYKKDMENQIELQRRGVKKYLYKERQSKNKRNKDIP